MFVFVSEQKVFFKAAPEATNASTLGFQTDLPLRPGNNVVTVFAREDDELQTRRTVVVYRRSQAAPNERTPNQFGAGRARSGAP